MTTLLLVRHGPSAYVHTSGAIDRAGVEQWRSHYDGAGILARAHPPTALTRIASQADCILTSDLPRARESAALLGISRPVVASSLLREFPLPVPGWPTRLPLPAWNALIYLHWRMRRWWGHALAPSDLARLADAVRYINEQLGAGACGVVVTHGALRVLLADQLRKDGWTVRARHGGYGHWSTWIFQRARRVTPATLPRADAV